MAEYTNVKVELEDRVAILTIDHPPANAFNHATLADLDAALDELIANEQVKVIIITGAGEFAFVAGADINEICGSQGCRRGKGVHRQRSGRRSTRSRPAPSP